MALYLGWKNRLGFVISNLRLPYEDTSKHVINQRVERSNIIKRKMSSDVNNR